MRGFLTILVVGFMLSGCAFTENLHTGEKGVWIGAKNLSYARFWVAANTVMSRRLKVTEADAKAGTITGVVVEKGFIWTEAVGLFVWPTENSDVGYTVDVDAMSYTRFLDPLRDWRKIIIEDLKKELGVS